MAIKRFAVIVLVLAASVVLVNTSFALWRHNSEVRFSLTISAPEHDDDICDLCTYDTIQEGIDLHKGPQYVRICNNMANFTIQLEARIIELNNLPFGGITYDELKAEHDYYMDLTNNGFGGDINRYASCINRLRDFYLNSTQKEKDAVPDFWDQHDDLWALQRKLWDERKPIYGLLKVLWDTGNSKIDY